MGEVVFKSDEVRWSWRERAVIGAGWFAGLCLIFYATFR